MGKVIVIGPDQIGDWLKHQISMENKPCNCERKKDLTNGYGSVRNIYCPDCKGHEYGGVKFTSKEWDRWINSDICCKIADGKLVVHHEDGREEPVTFVKLMEMVGHPNPWLEKTLERK